MKDTNVITSSEVTLYDNNVMATIDKLKSIYKDARKNLEFNNITEDHLKNRINALSVKGKIDKPNRDHSSYLQNVNTSVTTTQSDPAFDQVYELELPETSVTPLNSPIATSVLDRQIETHH